MSVQVDPSTEWREREAEAARFDDDKARRDRFAEHVPDDGTSYRVEVLERRLEEAEKQIERARGALFGAVKWVKLARQRAARASMDAGLYAEGYGPDAPLRMIEVPGGREYDGAIAALLEAVREIEEDAA